MRTNERLGTVDLFESTSIPPSAVAEGSALNSPRDFHKVSLFLVLVFILQSSGFAKEPHKHPVRTARQAVEVVRHYLQENGCDPKREEITATRGKAAWHVTSWHIFDPSAVGSSRFAPGGYTDYTISDDGRIVETLGGL